jgi:indolepyruvate ferredoxin oxidoreductase beta subunit
VINAVLFGAMAGSGVLPLTREACEQAIRQGGRGAEASLRGFAAGCEIALGQRPAPGEPAAPRRATELHEVMRLALKRLREYQGEGYAKLYERRMQPFLDGEGRLAAEVARHLALWMAYEDIIRVADLKTRASRFERIRKEVGAKDGEPVVVIDYLKPGIEEFASVLPRYLGRSWSLGREARQARRLQRRHAHQDERRLWLPAGALARLAAAAAPVQLPLSRGAGADRALACPGVRRRRARCGACARGGGLRPPHQGLRRDPPARQGELPRHRRCAGREPPDARRREQAAAIRKAREAALADPEGKHLGQALGKPVVWLKPVART